VWVQLGIGIALTALGVTASIAVALLQTADARLAMTNLHNFLYDMDGSLRFRLDRMENMLSEIRERLT
jgi:hypothetical protein